MADNAPITARPTATKTCLRPRMLQRPVDDHARFPELRKNLSQLPKLSPTLKMEAGTPQGAVPSPTLFNLFVDDLRESLNLHDIYLAQYADDIALWCTCKDPKEAQEKMNDALRKIAEWTTKWRIGLAPEKSVFMKFTRRPTHKKVPLKLNLLGTEVKQVSSHKFLGVNLDDRME